MKLRTKKKKQKLCKPNQRFFQSHIIQKKFDFFLRLSKIFKRTCYKLYVTDGTILHCVPSSSVKPHFSLYSSKKKLLMRLLSLDQSSQSLFAKCAFIKSVHQVSGLGSGYDLSPRIKCQKSYKDLGFRLIMQKKDFKIIDY